MEQFIALVDKDDKVVGYEEKHLVHSKGLLHRAFSIFIFNKQGEIMIQQRAEDKYHSPSLWTNTCCSHLPMNTQMDSFIHDRLMEEMGFDCELTFVTSFHYYVDFKDGMIENEIDHIYIGFYDEKPSPSADEVCNWKWEPVDWLLVDIERNPQNYTYWFKNILQNHFELMKSKL